MLPRKKTQARFIIRYVRVYKGNIRKYRITLRAASSIIFSEIASRFDSKCVSVIIRAIVRKIKAKARMKQVQWMTNNCLSEIFILLYTIIYNLVETKVLYYSGKSSTLIEPTNFSLPFLSLFAKTISP